MRALALLLCVAIVGSSGCEFGVRHPAVTAGILGGVVGLGTCEIGTDFESNKACALIGGGAAALLGGVVALAILLGGEGHTVLQEPMTEEPVPIVRDKKRAPAPAPDPAPGPAPAPAPDVPAPAPDAPALTPAP